MVEINVKGENAAEVGILLSRFAESAIGALLSAIADGVARIPVELGAKLDATLTAQTTLKETIVMNNAELEARLAALDAHLGKAATEIQTEVQDLKDELAKAGGTTPAVDAIVARLETKAQGLDDRNPDAPPPIVADPDVPTTGDDNPA